MIGRFGFAPGAQTNLAVMRFRLEDPCLAPTMGWKATAYVSGVR
jgi:hypothetical protein